MTAGQHLFLLITGFFALWFLFVLPYLLIMHFLMPRAILEKYFAPPYFGEVERALYTGIPYAPMRTIMLMSVITYPKLGRKRNLTELHQVTPRWYRIGSRFFMYQLIFIGGGIVTLPFALAALAFFIE